MPIGQQFLRAQPKIAYMGAIPGQEPFQSFFRRQFGDVYAQYQAELGRQAKKGLPRKQFPDFLSGYDWISQYYNYPRRERGVFPSRYAPRTRFLYY